jgi:hypothetical protein
MRGTVTSASRLARVSSVAEMPEVGTRQNRSLWVSPPVAGGHAPERVVQGHLAGCGPGAGIEYELLSLGQRYHCATSSMP